MDKKEAVSYIHQMLAQDHTREEIVRGLVDQLRAPEAIVSKFVAQTEAEYRKNESQKLPVPVPPQPVKLPPWLEELSTGQQSTQTTAMPVEPQPDWMQRLAVNTALSGVSVEADQGPLPDWALSSSQTSRGESDPSPYPTAPIPASPSWEIEAEKFVINQLQYERLQSDIADELADRVGISKSRAESFVAAIASQVQSAEQQKISNTAEAAEFVKTEYAKARPKLEIVADLAARTGEPQNLTEKFVALTITQIEKSKAQEKPQSFGQPSIDLNKPAIVNYVVSELAKNRKQRDIVMTICERTGADWSEAQRFVGQVYAERHTSINARKNRVIIPMCIGSIILGFIFTIGTVIPMIYLITGRTTEFISSTRTMGGMSDYIKAAPYIFLTGIGMVAGGVIGLIMAMRSQME